MTFKPNDACTLLESIFTDLQKALKKRNIKTPETTITVIEEHLQLVGLVNSKICNKRKRKTVDRKKYKKRAKSDVGKDEVGSPKEKDPSNCAVA